MTIPAIGTKDLSPNQQAQVNDSCEIFIAGIITAIPQLTGHFRSGGVIDIKTMSGLNLRVGFSPMEGGLILPGGIKPVSKGPRS